MKTFLAQNQFNSVDGSPPSPTEPAVASQDLQPRATAEHFDEPPSNEGRSEETPASAPSKNPGADALDVIDCIHEIFFYARKLMKGHRASMCAGCENPEFAYETVDGGALYRCADCGKGVHFSGADLAASSVIDEAAFVAEFEEVPLFIRDDGYLKRQA